MALFGKLTKRLIENLGPGRHGGGNGLYLEVDPSGARRWIVRVVVKGQKNRKGAPLRTDFGLTDNGKVLEAAGATATSRLTGLSTTRAPYHYSCRLRCGLARKPGSYHGGR